MGNLLVGPVSRHSLDRLNTSNDFQKKKLESITIQLDADRVFPCLQMYELPFQLL